MRRMAFLMALALPLVLPTAPTLALDRLPSPGAVSVVSHVADLDRPVNTRTYRPRADAYWHWHYRAAYTRWMHNEYVNAGYPVRHGHSRTYARAYVACCHRYRHW